MQKIKKGSKIIRKISQKKIISYAILTAALFSLAYISPNFVTSETIIPPISIDYPVDSEIQTVLPKETYSIQQTLTLTPEVNIASPVSTSQSLSPLMNIAHAAVNDGASTSATSKEYLVPTPNAGLEGIYQHPKNNGLPFVYFTENTANKIGRLATNVDDFTEWSIFTSNSGPKGVVVDPNSISGNHIVYFTENLADKIGKLEVTTGTMTEWSLPSSRGLESILHDGTGNVYFTENTANKIGKLDPATNTFTEWTVPTASAGLGPMVADATGKIYFIEFTANKIGRLIPGSGQFTEWTVPTASSGPYGIDAIVTNSGKDFIVFTENTSNKVGRLVTTTNPAVITEWNIPNPSSGAEDLTTEVVTFFIEKNTQSLAKFS